MGFRSSIGTNGTIGTIEVTWHSIGEVHLIKGTLTIFLIDQLEYDGILVVHWCQWYDRYQWDYLVSHWYTIGEMQLYFHYGLGGVRWDSSHPLVPMVRLVPMK